MRVLHIMGELRPSGAEVMLGLAAPLWREMGCELHVLAIGKSRGPYADTLERAGWTVHLFDSTAGRLAAIGQLSAAIRGIAPDVVHLHSERRNLPNTIAVRRCGIPMARTVHNNFQFSGILRLQKMVERMICRALGSQHVAISATVQLNERRRFLNRSVLCWNWFDAGRYRPPVAAERWAARERLGLPMDRKILLSVGNGSEVKNYAAIIDALAIADDPSLLYYQVGHPHPTGKDQELAARHKLADRVRFCGPRSDVLDWLWASDLFLMPSHFEGLSIAAAEALAAGCTCLFATSPGLTDFKGFGIEAFWAEPTARSVHDAIQRWQVAPVAEERLRRNAEIIHSEFNVDKRALDYLQLWRQSPAAGVIVGS